MLAAARQRTLERNVQQLLRLLVLEMHHMIFKHLPLDGPLALMLEALQFDPLWEVCQ